MSKIYFLPHSQKGLLNKKGMENYLKDIRDNYPTRYEIVTDKNHIEDLLYYLNFHYNDDKGIKEQIDLDNCEFFVDLPPEPRNSYFCFWVRDKATQLSLHFATREEGFIPPSPYKNFYNCLVSILIPYKKEKRREIAEQIGETLDSINLWHEQPTTKQLIDEFIGIEMLEDKLENIISPNGLGNNIPFLMPGYEYLEQKFLDFYMKKLANHQIKYDPKRINSTKE